MTSGAFKQIEDKTGEAFTLQEELVNEIARVMKRDKADINQAVYVTCIATGNPPLGVAHAVYEFLAGLRDVAVEKEQVA